MLQALHRPDNETMTIMANHTYNLRRLQTCTWTLHNYTEDPLPTLGDRVEMGYLNVLEVNATIPLNASANNVPR